MRTPTLRCLVLAAAALAGCATEPPPYNEVVTVKAGATPPTPYPGPGTVWRLDQNDLRMLSPAPIVPAPPPPQLPPPPRPNEAWPPPPPYWGPPY